MSNGIAVSIVPGELRLLVARTNGAVNPLHQLAAELPEEAVRPGLQGSNVLDPVAVGQALRRLADEAGATRERPGIVALLIPDAAVRMALVPLQGAPPPRAEGAAMARWALRDLLPVEGSAARVDWAVVGGEAADPAATWLLALGADAAVVREYESVVEAMGWTPGRVVPLSLALAVGASDSTEPQAGAARLVLSGAGGQVACLLESAGVPRMHRAWRGAALDLSLELPALQRYAGQRLGLSIVDAVLAGPEGWCRRAALDCEALGWKARVCSSWTGHLGSVQP